jgi:hypothetical protein
MIGKPAHEKGLLALLAHFFRQTIPWGIPHSRPPAARMGKHSKKCPAKYYVRDES